MDGDPYCINEAALESVAALWPDDEALGLADALATAFGRLVTEAAQPVPRRARDERGFQIPPTRRAVEDEPLVFHHHPASRFAYWLTGNSAVLFVDGEAHPAEAGGREGHLPR